MKAIFLSDVHLRDGLSVKTKIVIRFLEEVASRFERIYLLGDLFDVWPGTNAYLVRTFRPVVSTLRRLVENGHKVHYVEGNHDFRMGEYFTDSLGIAVHPDGVEHELGGRRVFLSHGDMGNPRDYAYRALRYVLRQDLLHVALRAVPQDWVYRLGSRTSHASRRYQGRVPRNEAAVRNIYRKTAESLFQSGYDVVIMGHTHLPDETRQRTNGRMCQYINTGDWVKHFTYLEFDGSDFYTKVHPVRAL